VSAPGKAIALIGFMAAGKSRAAAAMARALDEQLVDTDVMVADRIGEPVEDFFAREGEAAFRELEERAVLEALEGGGIVALGGGAVGSERVREALADHVPVWCRVDEGLAWERSKGSGRPLAADRGRFGELFAEREPIYRELARVVLPRGGDETPALAAPWAASLRAEERLRIAWGRTASAEYPVIVGAGAAEALRAPRAPRPGRRLFAVVDPAAVAGAGELPPGCEPAIEVDGGEQAKTLAEAGRVLGALARAGVRRDDALAAVGGGVVGDLAGFCAAVYQRGIPVVQVPTTLVAQVDSAIGGKTGVDLPEAKNYVGAYHQPFAVLTDPGALASLPGAELAAGFAEVVKTALIAGGGLWQRVREMREPGLADLGEVIFECALTKLTVVAEDERDSGRRAVLNLGHTVGHAIETATGYGRYRHGEAVALGMLAALRLSERDELREEVADLLASAGLPTRLDPDVDLDAVLAAVGRDKKRSAAGLGFVVVRAPGEVEHGAEVDPEAVRAAVEELRR
jgi:shikimate kinase / 3-dehydroquinate synthase